MSQSSGFDRVNELVSSYSRRLGASGATLDRNNDCAFGSCGFRYDETHNVLIGRAFVAMAMIKTADEQGRVNYRRGEKALNDPRIGGMFERGGAVFVLDEEKEAYFLVKRFLVVATSETELCSEMDELQNLAATWTRRWFRRVALIMHGHEPSPSVLVTRENDRE